MRNIIKIGLYASAIICSVYMSWKCIRLSNNLIFNIPGDKESSIHDEELPKIKSQKWRKFRNDKNQLFILRYIQYFEKCVLQNRIPKPIPKHRQQYLDDVQIKKIHSKINKMIEESLLE